MYRTDGYALLFRRVVGAGSKPSGGRAHQWALVTFINRRRTQIKVLAFEAGGYCIWSKRLEVGRFAPLSGAGSVKRDLRPTAFLALLEGVDLVIKGQRKRYEKVA